MQGRQTGKDDYVAFFFDVDGTVLREDTGQELFAQAGVCDPEEYRELMSRTHAPGREEPESGRGNELMHILHENPEDLSIDELEAAAEEIEVNPRTGLEKGIKALSSEGYTVVAHSAGWKQVIEPATNGHFDAKLAGELAEDGPVLNGRKQKPERMRDYLEQQGVEPEEAMPVFLGDSNTDLDAIRYAAENGGYGVALSDEVETARQRVDEASVYIGSENGDYAAALLHELTLEQDTERFLEEAGLDISNGTAETGELSYSDDVEEAIEYLEGMK